MNMTVPFMSYQRCKQTSVFTRAKRENILLKRNRSSYSNSYSPFNLEGNSHGCGLLSNVLVLLPCVAALTSRPSEVILSQAQGELKRLTFLSE